MTPELIKELIASGETLDVEFKGEGKKGLSDQELVEAVVCLANRPSSERGWLLIGVEDDGRVTGARPRHGAGGTDPLRVQALIANRTRPSLSCPAELVYVDSNPGGFPEGVHLHNLLVTPPRPRNPLLADAFRRAGIVERTGRGIDTIFYEQLRNGRPAPSYEQSTETDVVVVLHGGQANLAFVRLVAEEAEAGRPLELAALLVLNALWQERRMTTWDTARLIQRPEPEARAVLERLVETGLIEARGERRGRTYHLSASTYRRLGENAAYVRKRGYEPIQHEQMVLQFVTAHGRITRREAAELCQLGSLQAKRLLKRLVKTGRLTMYEKGKAAWYGLRP